MARYGMGARFKMATPYRGGSITVQTATVAYADIPSILATMDIPLPAQAGEVIEVVMNGMWGSQAVESYLDVATIVSAAAINYFHGSANQGIQGGWGAPSAFRSFSAVAHYTVQTADISNGIVTLRPVAKTSSNSAKTLYGGTWGFHFMAKNLGKAKKN